MAVTNIETFLNTEITLRKFLNETDYKESHKSISSSSTKQKRC